MLVVILMLIKFLHKKTIQHCLNWNRHLTISSVRMTDKATLETLKFDNQALKSLPIDQIAENYVRQVKNACFSKILPTPCENPSMVIYSKSAMDLLDLDETELIKKEAAEYFSGNKLLPGSETASHCYCGHQFGHFAGQLGDGAAIYLGEVLNKKGERWELQLKGAGKTPFSRTADGRKVLRSTLREFLASEAMHFLKIDTTRAGSCIISDTTVVRDIHYDGHPKLENCAIVSRISPTFIRFGSFEAFMPSRGPEFCKPVIAKQLLDYVCDSFFPKVDEDMKYESFMKEVIVRTAKLVAGWQTCGFVHGVLNTDNMSIMGLTIDYGPYGFLDRFDADFIFNGSDQEGRYTYRNQVKICEWNLNKLAKALEHIVPLEKTKPLIDQLYMKEYKRFYTEMMRKKLGLQTEKDNDENLIESFLSTMSETGADFTNSFRRLNELKLNGPENIKEDIADYLGVLLKECSSLDELKGKVEPKFKPETLQRLLEAVQENPQILAYYGLSQQFIQNEVANMEKFQAIKDWTMTDKRQKDSELWTEWLTKYMQRVYEENKNVDDTFRKQRIELLNSNNPRFMLRNHLIQEAIEHVEQEKDYTFAKILLKLVENPFSDEPLEKILQEFDSESVNISERSASLYYESSPAQEKCVKLSCSS